MKKYIFGINYNAYTKQDEVEITEIHIPACDESESRLKLLSLVAVLDSKTGISLQDVRDY